MGYQEAIFKTTEEKLEALENFIQLKQWENENTPYNYCSIPSTIMFKKDVRGETEYEEPSRLFRKGEKYVWATGERSAINRLPRFFNRHGFDVKGVYVEYLPSVALTGFVEFIEAIKYGKIQIIRNTRIHRKKVKEGEKRCPLYQTSSVPYYEETCFMDKRLINELKQQILNHPKTRLKFMML